MKPNLQAIVSKEMNRKEFLGYIGAGFLAVIGVTGLLKAILHHDNQHSAGSSLSNGYGGSSYGG